MRMAEKIFVAVIIIGYAMIWLEISGGELFIGFMINALAILYFPFGVLLFNSVTFRQLFKGALKRISKKRLIFSVGASYAFGTALLGILFNALKINGDELLLRIGIIGAALILVFALVKYVKSGKELFFQNMIIRSSLILIVSIVFYFS